MKATIHGRFVVRQTGKKKDGTSYVATTLLTGDETVRIFGYDPGDAVKELAQLDVLCEIRRSDKGLFIEPLSVS